MDVDDTAKELRRKVATATGLSEFEMYVRGDDEGENINVKALSAGDTVALAQTKQQESIAALHALGETDLTPERLASVEDPKVAQLFLQAEVVTAIPKMFLARSNLRSLDLSAPLAVTAIGTCFLSQCSSLESINLSGLRNVTTIGAYFLYNCALLRTFEPFNFAGLSSVRSLGNNFLSRCTSLTSIDFAGLGSVASVGYDFLSECKGLTSIDFSGLSSVRSLRNNFLCGCTSLTSIDFAGLCSVTSLGNCFLSRCTALTSINFAGLDNVTSLGDYFLSNCRMLTSVYRTVLKGVALRSVRHLGEVDAGTHVGHSVRPVLTSSAEVEQYLRDMQVKTTAVKAAAAQQQKKKKKKGTGWGDCTVTHSASDERSARGKQWKQMAEAQVQAEARRKQGALAAVAAA